MYQDSLQSILKNKSAVVTLADLNELKALTGIFSFLSQNEFLLQQSVSVIQNNWKMLKTKLSLIDVWTWSAFVPPNSDELIEQVLHYRKVATKASLH